MFISAGFAVDALRVHKGVAIDNGISLLLSVVVKVSLSGEVSTCAQSDDNDRARNAQVLIMVMGLVFINMIIGLVFIIKP
jgi:hypothetical protein